MAFYADFYDLIYSCKIFCYVSSPCFAFLKQFIELDGVMKDLYFLEIVSKMYVSGGIQIYLPYERKFSRKQIQKADWKSVEYRMRRGVFQVVCILKRSISKEQAPNPNALIDECYFRVKGVLKYKDRRGNH